MPKPWEAYGGGTLQIGEPEINVVDWNNAPQSQDIDTVGWQPPFKYEGIDPLLGLLETADYLTAAPIRYGVSETLKGLKRGESGPWNFFKGMFKSYANPMTAPSGKDIMTEAGVSDKPIGEFLNKAREKTGIEFGGLATKASPAGATGFMAENVLDPTNLVPAGMIGAGVKKARKGVDYIDVYHGSPNKFDKFDPKRIGEQGGEGGVWFTDKEYTAKQYMGGDLEIFDEKSPLYGDYKRVQNKRKDLEKSEPDMDNYPDDDKGFNQYLKDSKIHSSKWNELVRKEESLEKELPKVIETVGSLKKAKVKFDSPYVYDYRNQAWDESKTKDVIKHAKDHGHDGVIFKNMIDDAYGLGVSSNQYVLFDVDKANKYLELE
jgi:hypothetical protein